jgi:CheY-like chemotaxis protein
VLVVEDLESIQAAVQRTLTSRGYHVLQAGRPTEALELIAQGAAKVDLVLTDLRLPEMSGMEVVDRLRERHGRVTALFMSGFAAGALAHQGAVDPGAAFLQKPFTPAALLRKVRTTLDARGSP